MRKFWIAAAIPAMFLIAAIVSCFFDAEHGRNADAKIAEFEAGAEEPAASQPSSELAAPEPAAPFPS